MGGYGSGRNEYATTPTVEECRGLDMDNISGITESPHGAGTIRWDGSDSWLRWRAKGVCELGGEERAARIQFIYTTTHYPSEESTDVNYTVPVDYTEPNYGGIRPWFVCPGCDTRRRKLYLPPIRGAARYLCRECYDLGYHSSRTSGNELEQSKLRYRRAFAKADAKNRRPHPNGTPYLPERPKGMHQETFDELLADIEDAREENYRAFMSKIRDMANVDIPALSGEHP